MSDEIPFELQGFEPISRIGGGGFGEVWLARQSNIDRKVAVKVGHAPIDDKTVQLRFERECIALGRLSGHPNIIDVFTAGQMDDGRPYLVLEFVNGGTLWQRLQRGPLSEPELCRVGSQLCDAIGVAHGAGVLHRDLKPENVLLRQNGEAVLGDFGIARLHDGANTTSHAITASVAYAAPEILSGKSASVSSDLYGIGICLLASILRSVPFVQKTDESIHPIINRVLTDKPPDLRRHGISDGLSHAVGALLEKNPNKRPATAEEAKKLIELAANPPPPAAVTEPPAAAASPAAPSPATTVVPGSNDPTRPPSVLGSPATAPVADANATQISTGAMPTPSKQRPVSSPPGGLPANPIPPSGDPTDGRFPAATGPTPPGPAQGTGPVNYAAGGRSDGTGRPALQSQPYAPASGPPTYLTNKPSNPSDKIRVFGAAFGATLLLGGLLIFGISRFSGDDDPADTTTTVALETTSTEAGAGDTTESTPSTTAAPVAFALPLALEDLRFGDDANTSPDTEGPDSSQFCDNTPVTVGLSEWEGVSYSEAAGYPLVFQQLARFDTAAQATAYVTSYMATVNCSEWTIPGDDGTPDVAIRPEIVANPPTVYGDETREIVFEGNADIVTVVARASLMRKGADVFLLTVTSILDADLNDLDRLLGLAAERLDFGPG